MPQIIRSFFLVTLVVAALSQPSLGAATASPPSISVDAEGKVMATPDVARLTIEVETQAATAAAAGQENAKQTDWRALRRKARAGPRGQTPDPGLSSNAGTLL